MASLFSLKPMTRGERAASLVVQVFSFGVCAFGIVECLQPWADVGTFICTGGAFAGGVVLRVRRQLSPRPWEVDGG